MFGFPAEEEKKRRTTGSLMRSRVINPADLCQEVRPLALLGFGKDAETVVECPVKSLSHRIALRMVC
jgi:hypothetical protein